MGDSGGEGTGREDFAAKLLSNVQSDSCCGEERAASSSRSVSGSSELNLGSLVVPVGERCPL